ncbi:mCG147119 [Mus musculus]|nr:mCG147119 [Mus musculus]
MVHFQGPKASSKAPLLKGFPASHPSPPKDRIFNTQNFIPKRKKELELTKRSRKHGSLDPL